MTVKPKILLCWGYSRSGWVKYFERLNDTFEFIYLFYMYPEEETISYTSNKKIYYTSYGSPFRLLRENGISKVIFMGMDGWQNIAINIAAREMKIPTFFMMHGAITVGFEGLGIVEYKKRNLLRETFTKKLNAWIFNFRFLINGLGIKHIRFLPKLLRLQIQKTNMHPAVAMRKNKFILRNPDRYIVFSEPDINYFVLQDGCDRSRFTILGNLEITSFIQHVNQFSVEEKPYLLYIETPLSIIKDNAFDVNLLTKDQYNQLLMGMSNYAKMNGLKLIVKLHPYSYKNDYYVSSENIEYLRHVEVEPLILNSTAVIFYNSSLTIPALYFKNCCLLKVNKLDDFQRRIASLNICSVVDYKEFINDFENISFLNSQTKETIENKRKFNSVYIEPNNDGKGIERLKNVLLEQKTL